MSPGGASWRINVYGPRHSPGAVNSRPLGRLLCVGGREMCFGVKYSLSFPLTGQTYCNIAKIPLTYLRSGPGGVRVEEMRKSCGRSGSELWAEPNGPAVGVDHRWPSARRRGFVFAGWSLNFLARFLSWLIPECFKCAEANVCTNAFTQTRRWFCTEFSHLFQYNTLARLILRVHFGREAVGEAQISSGFRHSFRIIAIGDHSAHLAYKCSQIRKK